MLQRMLFDTRVGNWLLAQLEARAGLAVVSTDWLGTLESGSPAGDVSTQPGQTVDTGSTGDIVPPSVTFVQILGGAENG